MARIAQSTIDDIYTTPLSSAVSFYVDIKKRGSVLVGYSPFSNEKTPSFTVSDGKGIWKCFSSGKGGNNIISLVMELENIDFPTAVERVAKKLNIAIRYEEETKEAKEKREQAEILQSLVSQANTQYQKNFKNLPADHWAKKYMLETRGFSEEILEQFGIGYAYNDSRLTSIIKSKGLLADALEVGLVKQKGEVEHYDFFRDRIMNYIFKNLSTVFD